MKLFSLFTARRTTPAKRTTRLSLTQLEARDVPASGALDLTHVGASGSIGGVIFTQYDDHTKATKNNGPVSSFLRLDDGGREQGYNTDARPLQFDASPKFTHSLAISTLPEVTIGTGKNAVTYAELVLDVNEPTWTPLISLDQLQLFVSNNKDLSGYNSRNDTLGGLKPVYDMNAGNGGDRWVKIDANLNHSTGMGDVIVDVPIKDLAGGKYLTLYSQFGQHNGAGGQYEEWGPGFGSAPTATISGIAFVDHNDNQKDDIATGDDEPFTSDWGQILLLDSTGTVVQRCTPTATGFYTFTVPLSQSTTYTLESTVPSDPSDPPLTVTLVPGENTTLNLPVLPTE